MFLRLKSFRHIIEKKDKFLLPEIKILNFCGQGNLNATYPLCVCDLRFHKVHGPGRLTRIQWRHHSMLSRETSRKGRFSAVSQQKKAQEFQVSQWLHRRSIRGECMNGGKFLTLNTLSLPSIVTSSFFASERGRGCICGTGP